jgi:hypothetical protein
MRKLVEPPLPSNFVRDNGTYERSDDGLHLIYNVVDREVMWTGPLPLVNPKATFSIRQQYAGAMAACQLSGSFEAPPAYSKADLIQRAAELLLSRLGSASLDDESIHWQEKSITEEVYENQISFSFGWETNNIDAILAGFGAPPPGSDGAAQPIGSYGGDGVLGNSGVKAAPPVIGYDACQGGLAVQNPSGIGGVAPGGITITTPRPLSVAPVVPPGPGKSNLSIAHQQSPYLFYFETVSTEVDNGMVTHYPKIAGAKPIHQRVRNVSVVIIQCGYLTRVGKANNPPPPAAPLYPPGSPVATLTSSTIAPQSPLPLVAANQVEHTIHWRYTMKMNDVPETVASLQLAYPKDVRIDDPAAPIPDFGEIVPPVPGSTAA